MGEIRHFLRSELINIVLLRIIHTIMLIRSLSALGSCFFFYFFFYKNLIRALGSTTSYSLKSTDFADSLLDNYSDRQQPVVGGLSYRQQDREMVESCSQCSGPSPVSPAKSMSSEDGSFRSSRSSSRLVQTLIFLYVVYRKWIGKLR